MTHKILITLMLSLIFAGIGKSSSDIQDKPVRIVVAGLTHDHVHWLFGRDNEMNDIEVAGIYEPNKELWHRYRNMYNLDPNLYYNDLDEMLQETRPEAVTAFGSTYDHLKLVEAAAPNNIHIMVEKPLAVNLDHAMKMKKLAEENNVHLITNYETTWYASNHEIYRMFEYEEHFGKIRKIVVNDGHQGPKEIGVSREFLEWLTDPVLNGGGAIMDFGCYGANLITWLMDGREPLTVTAITQTHKPDVYAEVDDEATIILTYPETQGIVQASWNWPYNRKDMQVYGETGYAYALDDVNMEVLNPGDESSESLNLSQREYPFDDPFSYLAAVVRGEVRVKDSDLSSLDNNVVVMKILDAAKRSAESGQTIILNQ